MTRVWFWICVLSVVALLQPSACVAQNVTTEEAKSTLHKVVTFYRSEVGYQGAYLWKYASDLTYQEGEGVATSTSGWTQPPGSPFVGEAYLKAWRLTDDPVCLDAAVEVAGALVRAQLKSGGWSSHFDLAEPGRRSYAYRVDGENAGKNNYTTFDDNKSQSALTLLMHVDEALSFRDSVIHEAVEYSLQQMLAAQYPNGAWPQQYSAPPDPGSFPVKPASYPKSWSRTYEKQKYIGHYTLNDNNMSWIVDMLLEAHRIYDRQDCFDAAVKTGDFFLLSQMPEPQPGWAQQYDLEMHPAWARKFEPPAITGGESQSVMRTLIRLYRFTGERRFVEIIPAALNYYRNSLLPDGQLARFYELQTNTPLYFTKDYQLTDSDADMPTHYAFKVGSKLDSLEREYRDVIAAEKRDLMPKQRPVVRLQSSSKLAGSAAKIVKQLDARGAWVEKGSMRHQEQTLNLIDMRTFAENIEILAAYAGSRP